MRIIMTLSIPGTRRCAINRVICAAATGLLIAASTPALAQDWPAKPVKILVGASPGGGTDIVARMIGDKFQSDFKQPFIVENRPGASNTIAADVTAKAPPDGYTMLVATTTGAAIAPHLIKLGYDPQKSLVPVALLMTVPNVLVVNNDVPAKTVKELVPLIKANPDKYSYGSSGTGSTQHLAGEAFAHALDLKMVHIPYKGSAQALTDLLGGQIQMMFDTTSSAAGHIASGKIRPLAVMSPKRARQLPNVPTLAEAGYPGIEMTTWYGLFVPAGTPKAIIDRLYDEIAKVLKMPDVLKRIDDLAGEPGSLTQAQFVDLTKADYDRFGKLVREAKVVLQQ
jgi:tripartite-type tricarboxylate transporter receptor subunit TctC